jgi:type IV secretion system protein VirB9
MQRVSWSYPEVVVLRSATGGPSRAPEAAADAVRVPALPPSSTLPAPAPGVDPARLDFDYGISGEAPFRPLAVFDDGRATWLRIPGHDLLPVLYGEDAEGERMVHYAVRGDWLIAARIAPSWVLRAGNAMVRIERHPGGPAHAQRPPPAFWR